MLWNKILTHLVKAKLDAATQASGKPTLFFTFGISMEGDDESNFPAKLACCTSDLGISFKIVGDKSDATLNANRVSEGVTSLYRFFALALVADKNKNLISWVHNVEFATGANCRTSGSFVSTLAFDNSQEPPRLVGVVGRTSPWYAMFLVTTKSSCPVFDFSPSFVESFRRQYVKCPECTDRWESSEVKSPLSPTEGRSKDGNGSFTMRIAIVILAVCVLSLCVRMCAKRKGHNLPRNLAQDDQAMPGAPIAEATDVVEVPADTEGHRIMVEQAHVLSENGQDQQSGGMTAGDSPLPRNLNQDDQAVLVAPIVEAVDVIEVPTVTEAPSRIVDQVHDLVRLDSASSGSGQDQQSEGMTAEDSQVQVSTIGLKHPQVAEPQVPIFCMQAIAEPHAPIVRLTDES